jgi:biopolymer transport protein ExbB
MIMNAHAQTLSPAAASSAVPAADAPASVVQDAQAAVASVATPPAQELGFVHFIQQTDGVGQGLFAILVVMSVISWALITIKGVSLFKRQRRSRAFLNFFWNATSLEAVQHEIATHGVSEPFAHLTAHAMHAQAHHARFGAAKLEEAGSAQDFLTRTIKKVLDEETMRMESGLSVLATIGATAPFVGLFGTVWGVYHALLAIGATGAGTLDKVAGPVGEALIMTGLGLAVAIPAVMGYNWLTRSNRVWSARLDAFAFELFTFLSTGQTLKGSGQDAPGGGATVRPLKPNTSA